MTPEQERIARARIALETARRRVEMASREVQAGRITKSCFRDAIRVRDQAAQRLAELER